MSVYKMQQQFEEWFMESMSTDGMGKAEKKMAWECWQASRAALVIELPSPEDQCDDGAVGAINRCIEAIEAAGVKVKS